MLTTFRNKSKLHRESKNGATVAMATTLSILDGFAKFTAAKSSKFPTKPILGYHHTLNMLLHYLGRSSK